MSKKEYCPNCGEMVTSDDRFCPACGENLRRGMTPTDEDDSTEEYSVGTSSAGASSAGVSSAGASSVGAFSAGTASAVSSTSQSSTTLPRLDVYADLEEGNKSTLTTFYVTYERVLQEDTGWQLAAMGKGIYNFNGAISSLSSIIESELKASLMKLMNKVPDEPKPTLGMICFLINKENFTRYGLQQTEKKQMCRLLEKIIRKRNQGTHTDGQIIDKDLFRAFYMLFCDFYVTYIPLLLDIKKHLRQEKFLSWR